MVLPMGPLVKGKEMERVQVMMPPSMLQAVETYCLENHTDLNDAVCRLIQIGLAMADEPLPYPRDSVAAAEST